MLEDVRNELVSRRAAREHYGVVLVEGAVEVDREATAALRADEAGRKRSLKLDGWRDRAWFENGRVG